MSKTEIASHGLEARCRSDFWPRSRFYQGQYGRLFRELPPVRPSSKAAADKYFEYVLNASVGGGSQGVQVPTMPAGYTYFGQFVAHDITFNPISDLTEHRDPESIINFRSPRLDLDSLYGRGPRDSAYFYDHPTDGGPSGRLSIGWGFGYREEDLPRNEGEPAIALIGDPRNDENTMISQLHLAFIKLHNRFLRDTHGDFACAQRLTCWHYQWVVLNDYLPRVCDAKVLQKIRATNKPTLQWFEWRKTPFIPLEFSGAAFRFGHSMVRDSYRLNFTHFVPIPVFGWSSFGNLRGFRRLQQTWTVQWDHFLEFNDPGVNRPPQLSGPIDLTLSESLRSLPNEVLSADDLPVAERNLLKLNIQRGFQLELPSGQAVARAIGADKVLDPLGADKDPSCVDPLWVYVLREAKEQHQGTRLGEVGSTIVAETLVGLIAGDKLSYLNIDPKWIPTLPPYEKFELRDLIREAGMPITKTDLQVLPGFQNEHDPRGPLLAKMQEIRRRKPR